MITVRCVPFFWLTSLMAFSDTVTTTDNLSYNGAIKGMAGGELKLEGRFKDGAKTLTFKQNQLDSIEFNDETYNSGPPPDSLAFRPGKGTAPSPTSRPTDIVIFHGGERKSCTLSGIDEHSLHCSGSDLDRADVVRVLIRR